MTSPSPPRSAAGRLSAALRSSPPLAWSFLYFFCLLSGYYVLRPVREAMSASADVEAIFPTGMTAFFAAHGVPLKDFTLQVLFTCTFLIMVLLQPVYGALVSRYPRRVFLPAVYGFFIATLLLFYVLFDSGVPGRGMAFFLWVTVFNLFAVAVFWSFMADVFSNAEARNYYGYIGAAGTLGAFLGPILTRTLVERIGIAHLMLVSAGFLTVCVVCVLRLRLWAVAREQERQLGSGEVPMGGDVLGGLKLIVREPLLRWLAFMVLFGVGVGTLLYNEQAALVRRLYTDAAAATAYYASIDLAINALTLVLQLLVTRALLSRFGIAPALLIPGVAITLGYAVLTASPLPMMLAIVQVITRSSEFALAKPARETLYTRVDREWRYKAGAAIDTVIYRGGDLTFVWVHKLVSAFGSSAVFGVGLLVASGMTLGAFGLLREARKLPAERDAETGNQVSD
ncbi:NTP/NDP exchange transporter [Xanthomonas arboricola pv. corylina]|uniref:MFS transporter n=1 Tax=Xanthomonas arboricola pv. corylina TaxID=487821 RepID=A0A8D6UVY9_9XANT|nr:MFS transporter [Xanthomonas arboricola]MDN0202421.1 MFS transporter [Xanthomonas arboricola pv. corylina]MDN0206470.1 MFS transporter [Xanthomonas arboricola pv. corylina]MDN0210445.1 MFS transporter [Xanthomonas arboricola pv. corylina]MDN0215056.1 MFS transporter [Xanthomonas arboricola pv. corylina]NIK33865.1 AAA family ATP:ADP antiporter [Xanthomonas arboricola]